MSWWAEAPADVAERAPICCENITMKSRTVTDRGARQGLKATSIMGMSAGGTSNWEQTVLGGPTLQIHREECHVPGSWRIIRRHT